MYLRLPQQNQANAMFLVLAFTTENHLEERLLDQAQA